MPLAFNSHQASKRPIRGRLGKYAQSDLRPQDFQQGDGIVPAEVFAAYKYLPVSFQDVNTTDYVVIPKGRICGAITKEDTLGNYLTPVNSGSIFFGLQASELGAGTLSGSVDTSFFGYDDFVAGLLVPANGGVISSGYYSTYDIDQTLRSTGVLVASGATPFILPANAPIGVAYMDVYQDLGGKYLNYDVRDRYHGVLCDAFVTIPFVKVDTAGSYSGVAPQYNNTSYANLLKWYDVNKMYTYLSVDVTGGDVFRAGVPVMSDSIGNYKIQGGASSLTQAMTAQTVGKILGIDSRYPKSDLQNVQTYPGSGMPGTATAGIPKQLFDFTYQSLRIGLGTTPTVEEVYNAVRSGSFGMVRIQLHVS